FLQTVLPAAGAFDPAFNSNAFDKDPNTQHQNEYNLKLDHTFGQKDSVWFRYSRINSNVLKPTDLPGLTTNQAIPGRNWGGESVVLTPQATDNNQFSVTLNKLKGTHTFTFGANYISSVFSSPLSFDSVSFANGQTGDGNGNAGFSVASALIGVPDSANRRDVDERTRPGGLFSAFFQDSWKASPKLTLNYGIRYDLTLIPPYGTQKTIDKSGGIETGDFDFSNGTYVLQYPPPPCTVRGHAPCIPSILLDANGNAVACDPATQPCLPAGTLPPHVVVDSRGRISHNTYTNLGPHLGSAS